MLFSEKFRTGVNSGRKSGKKKNILKSVIEAKNRSIRL